MFDADASDAAQRLAGCLPAAYRDNAQRALAAGRSLLIVTVDETDAFNTRKLLDEETCRLETVVLPRAAAPSWRAVSTEIATAP